MIRGSSGLPALGAVALLVLLLTACPAIDPGLPSANAGADQAVAVGATVSLDGSGSHDTAGRSLSFAWSFVSTPAGSEATISAAAQASASFVADRAGTYVVELAVSTGGQRATDTTSITASPADTALLEPGESVIHVSGTVLAAQPESFTGSLAITITETDDPSLVVPLPRGVTVVGQAYTISSTPAVAADHGQPFVVGLTVPAGVDAAGLALAVLERDNVYASFVPPDDDDEAPLGPSWIVLEGAFESAANLLLASVLALDEDGWDVVLVRAEGFETTVIGEVDPGAFVESSATLSFAGVCGPGFADAVETCTAADRTAAAAMLEASYFDLTDFGFTTTPRLMRGARSWDISFSPLRIRIVPGPYLVELRPSSAEIAGGMFSSSTGRIWIAIGTAGVDESRRRVVRHEYVHATQYGYGVTFASTAQWLRSRWVEEGQAVLLDGGYAALRRANRGVRAMDFSLERSKWSGSSWLPGPASEYETQDFWLYLANRFGHTDASFVRPFMERGMLAADIDQVLRAQYPAAFGGAGADSGLSRAYWEWAKNQVFTKQVDMTDPRFGQTCAFTAGSATPTVIAYGEGQSVPIETRTLDPLTTHVYRIDFAQPAHTTYLASMLVSSTSSATRSVFYRDDQAGTDGCFGQADSASATVNVEAALRYYVVVSNTSRTASAEHSLAFAALAITTPSSSGSVDEGPIGFRALATGFAAAPSISWSYQRVSGGTPFIFGPTSSGETVTRTLCDGAYYVRAEARSASGAPLVSQTLRLRVDDLGATQVVAGCTPTVTITQPVAGGTYATGVQVALRADAVVRGETTYPVQWRRDSVAGQVVATGSAIDLAFFDAGPVLLFATFGVASDSVSFTLADGTPPSASIDDPDAGATFAWFDYPQNVNGIAVTFSGSGLSGAGSALPASALRWEYRRSDLAPWSDGGTGSTKEIFFGYGGTAVSQAYDVRLVATDPVTTLIGTDTITIVIQRPPD